MPTEPARQLSSVNAWSPLADELLDQLDLNLLRQIKTGKPPALLRQQQSDSKLLCGRRVRRNGDRETRKSVIRVGKKSPKTPRLQRTKTLEACRALRNHSTWPAGA